MSEEADRVHLICSVPLPSCEGVFRRVAGELGPFLRRLPDGETGERGRWIFFQNPMLRAHPALEEDPTEPPFRFVQWDGRVVRETMRLRLKPADCVGGLVRRREQASERWRRPFAGSQHAESVAVDKLK